MKLLVCLAATLAAVPLTLEAQFYAPETNYHDICQRTFPVEAARVLAWIQNSGGGKIAEITYAVETNADGAITWRIAWRGPDGALLREATATYSEAALLRGPQFFREAFAQLAGKDWQPAKSGPAINGAFWKGAARAGLSRAESITAAGALVPSEAPDAPRAAELAGALAHAAVPIIGRQFTIDSVLLSRAAAWLCIAESLAGAADDAAWCPILFLSGREKAASALWLSKGKPSAEGEWPVRFWDFILKKPLARDAFVFAARPENRPFAMPLLVYFGNIEIDYTQVICESARVLFDSATLPRLHDYGPLLTERGGVGGGRLVEGAWPMLARQAWLAALRQLRSAPPDFTGYADALKSATAKPADEPADESLAGLKEAAPLLDVAFRNGAGPLIPVAHVTARDLLNFGWESEGVQLGVRYNFVKSSWSVPELAKQIAEAAFQHVGGIGIFFGKSEPKAPDSVDPLRLQFVTDEKVSQHLARSIPAPWKAAGPLAYARRCWLWKMINCCQVEALSKASAKPEEFAELLTRIEAEGGMLSDSRALAAIYSNIRAPMRSSVPGIAQLEEKLIAELPSAFTNCAGRLWHKFALNGKAESWFRYAQELEKLGWSLGLPVRYWDVFTAHLQSAAWDSFKRYYRQVRPFVTDSVQFSNGTGPRAWTLGWLTGDRDLMETALRDSQTFSYSSLVLMTTAALEAEKYERARELIEACIERYESDEMQVQMRDFLPLIPALKEKQHADHERALDYFKEITKWPTAQWVLLKTCKLDTEDSVRFLGGDNTGPERALLVAALRGDKAKFAQLYAAADMRKFPMMGFVLIHYLRAELLGIKPPENQPDLMPPGAQPLTALIQQSASMGVADEARRELDLSRAKTADELWTLVELQREPPAAIGEEGPRGLPVQKWIHRQRIAAETFLEKFPNDRRRWDAKLMVLETGATLARLGHGPQPDPAAHKALAQQVLASTDATDGARGDADFLLVTAESTMGDPNQPKTLTPLREALLRFIGNHPNHRYAVNAGRMLIQVLEIEKPLEEEQILARLSMHQNSEVAGLAKVRLASRRMRAQLEKNPVELKFTATDGAEIDISKLRGKVVLLEFWTSWCVPCLLEMPRLVGAYRELQPRGFEIIGISLDHDRTSMEEAIERHGMKWPQHFDGGGFQNEIGLRFGIQAIPAAWLFDKKGLLRETGLRGEKLIAAAQKLLAE
jgi:peroxiredoxin